MRVGGATARMGLPNHPPLLLLGLGAFASCHQEASHTLWIVHHIVAPFGQVAFVCGATNHERFLPGDLALGNGFRVGAGLMQEIDAP